MESFVDTQSLSTTASSSTPHTPSPPMEDPAHVEYAYEPSGQYYLDYQTQNQPMSLPQHIQHPQQHHIQHPQAAAQQVPPVQSQLMEDSHPSATAGPLYRRASFPFVHHDHPMSQYPKFPPPDSFVQDSHPHHQHPHPHPQMTTHEHPYELEDSIKLEHASAMVVPTQIPQTSHQHPQPFYRPASSSSSMSSISPSPVYLNAGLSSIPVMHTDDAASKETQYLRRKCFNCGTTEPPSWRRSTLNPGKIVCNKCGLYERTHNKPRPHQFGLRPGNKARKQPSHPQLSQSGRLQGHSPTSSPKRHGLSLKKEPIDYSYAMRRGSIASINSGSGTSDWDDHSGYSTASSAYPSSLGMAPPPQHHALGNYPPQSHVPNHHGHHPYNNALSMPPPRSMSSGIRLPQAPPMKVPTKAGSSSPVTSANIVPGSSNSSNPAGNAVLTGSPENMHLPAPGSVSGQQHSPYTNSPSSTIPPTSLNSTTVAQTMYSGGPIRGPPPPTVLPSPDYYARRGSTSQIPHHHASPYQHDHHLAMMRRGSVGAISMGMSPTTTNPLGFGSGRGAMMQHKTTPPPPLPSHMATWQQQPTSGLPLTELGPTVAGTGSSSAGSTPGQRYHGATDLTPSPPQPTAHMMAPVTLLSGAGSTGSSPIGGPPLHPDLASLTA